MFSKIGSTVAGLLGKLLATVFTFDRIVTLLFAILNKALKEIVKKEPTYKAKRYIQFGSAAINTIGEMHVQETPTKKDDKLLKELEKTIETYSMDNNISLPIVPKV